MIAPRRAAGPAALLLALAVALLTPAAQVAAHAQLVSSSPTDGSVLTAPPAALSFTFGELLLARGNAIAARPQGSTTPVELPAVTVVGDTASVPWPATTPSGTYVASYRVVSADGHPVQGSITFTVAPASPVPAPVVESGSGSSGSGSSASATLGSSASAPASPTSSGGSGGLVGWLVALGIAAVIGVAAGTWFTRRSRGR